MFALAPCRGRRVRAASFLKWGRGRGAPAFLAGRFALTLPGFFMLGRSAFLGLVVLEGARIGTRARFPLRKRARIAANRWFARAAARVSRARLFWRRSSRFLNAAARGPGREGGPAGVIGATRKVGEQLLLSCLGFLHGGNREGALPLRRHLDTRSDCTGRSILGESWSWGGGSRRIRDSVR